MLEVGWVDGLEPAIKPWLTIGEWDWAELALSR